MSEGKIWHGRIDLDGSWKDIHPYEIHPFKNVFQMEMENINTMEDEKKSLEEYETLLVKIYWYLKGLNLDKDDGDINDLVTMIEELI